MMSNKYIDVYELQFFFGNISGYGHIDFKIKWHALLYSAYHLTVLIYLLFNNFLCLYTAYRNLDDLKEEMYSIVMLLTTGGCTIKIFEAEMYRNEANKLNKKLKNQLYMRKIDSYSWTEEIQKDTERWYTKIALSHYTVLSGAVLSFVILPMFYPGERALPYLFPVDNLVSPYYEIVYVFQCFIILVFILNTVSYDLTCCGFLMRLSSHMEVISTNLDKFSEYYPCPDYSKYIQGYSDSEKIISVYSNKHGSFRDLMNYDNYMIRRAYDEQLTDYTVKFLKDNIIHHQEIIRQISKVDMMFNQSIFIQLMGGSILFCIAASVLFNENVIWLKDSRMGTFAVFGFLDMFLFCYCGTYIMNTGEKVEQSLYSLPWYEMHPKARKMISYMLVRLHNMKGITAGRVIGVNLDLYLQIMKFAHSFIALLKEL